MLDAVALERIDAWLDGSVDRIVSAVSNAIRFRTVTYLALGSDERIARSEEYELQNWFAAQLRELGADVDQWEPEPASLTHHPLMQSGLSWEGRPITVGKVIGSGGGKSLCINGHIDVVPAGDLARWSVDPFAGEVHDGRVYGRGACDMKGGLVSALFAMKALRASNIALRGDVILEVVADEESCGMGTVAAIDRGYAADAGLVPEPTNLDIATTTRGTVYGSFRVEGRTGHADTGAHASPEDAPVNALERAAELIRVLAMLRSEWESGTGGSRAPRIQATVAQAGTYVSNVPDACYVGFAATYPPTISHSDVMALIEQRVTSHEGDSWWQEHPARWSWDLHFPASEVSDAHSIVRTVQGAASTMGLAPRCVAFDSAHDGALLTTEGDTPAPAFGPGDLARAHTADEFIEIDELVTAAKVYARVLCNWCGVV